MNPWQQLLDRASEPTTRTPAGAPEKRKAPENLELEVGKRIGEWTLLKFRFGQSTPVRTYFSWLCRCSCGEERWVPARRLRAGYSKSCGHTKLAVGDRVGEWTLLKYMPGTSLTEKRTMPQWLCRCSCGVERSVAAHNLSRGVSKSCGHPTNRKPRA